jgi:gliding motility-associated-like protein
VTKPRRAAAPGAFTPNGDGTNDIFFIQGDDKVSKVLVFRVYDRWGELIFSTENTVPNDPITGWDGTFKGEKMNSGVYAWYAEVEYIDGFKEVLKGDVTLLR